MRYSPSGTAPAWVPHGVTNLLHRGLLSPQVLPGACSSMGSPWCHSLVWASSCSGMGLFLVCRWVSAPPWISMGCGGQPASPWSSPRAAGKSLLWCLEHLLPLLLHWPWCLQSCFSHIFSLISPAGNCPDFFSPFLTMLSQRCCHHCWWARPCPVTGPSWNPLALALSDTGEASSSFSQKLPL